tara:strand:+ start:352 stop:846 length:495 start_codon:yes stop_codon:yes gene_type:complete
MAITFRGQAKNLNKEVEKQNKVGFQQKSSASPRQGVGGQEQTLNSAIHEFAKRNPKSPAKIKKNFYGGEAYFQDGYSGDLSSPAKKSCSPITAKAKSSPFKMNEALVAGAALTNKKFLNVSAIVGEGFKTGDAAGEVKDMRQASDKEASTNDDGVTKKELDGED